MPKLFLEKGLIFTKLTLKELNIETFISDDEINFEYQDFCNIKQTDYSVFLDFTYDFVTKTLFQKI